MKLPGKPWTIPATEVLRALDVDAETGLTSSDVRSRREEFGENVLQRRETRPAWRIFIAQFRSLLVGLLAVGAGVSFAFGETIDATAILSVVVINALIGFVTELRAVREMEALRELGGVHAVARRDGELTMISATELVPGDIVAVDGGDVVIADIRLVEASRLQVDESALTGESVPETKRVEPLGEDIDLADRENMLYKGTAVTRGRGEGVVVATGMKTELGRITELVHEAADEKTPLEKRLDRLGRVLAYISVGFALVIAVTGLMSGKSLVLVMQTAIALLVATVPEGLPIVATIALARGMSRMVAQNALVEELSAVETLGSTNIILTDKTGTLTENQMTVRCFVTAEGQYDVTGAGLSLDGEFMANGDSLDVAEHPELETLVVTAALCTDAELTEARKSVGDPMELALLVAASKAGWSSERLAAQYPQIGGEAFDPDQRMMATMHRKGDEVLYAVKGAPEDVLEACGLDPDQCEWWLARNEELATDGLRVLGIACKAQPTEDGSPYSDLEFLGMVGMVDPPREDVRAAMDACVAAGIRVVMVTGDQAPTAANVARSTGLAARGNRVVLGRELEEALGTDDEERVLSADVIARTSPEQKLALIAAHQKDGSLVAMIGDGVNDAPALRKADIGVAMGLRGTQVAREAAAIVLRDDRFATIVAAIEEGRVIFRNIRTFVVYLISCNLSEIVVVGSISLFEAPLPLLPLQILFLNLVTDVFPALALGVGEGDESIMKNPPREPGEPVLTRRHWLEITAYGLLLSVCVIAAYVIALVVFEWPEDRVVTISFLTLAIRQLLHVFNMASHESHPLNNEVTRNPWVWGALVLCGLLIVGGVYIPAVRDVLGVRTPNLMDWGFVLAFASIPMFVGRGWAVGSRFIRGLQSRT